MLSTQKLYLLCSINRGKVSNFASYIRLLVKGYKLNIVFFCFFRISQFIIGVNKYMAAMKNGYSVGMRFRMRFEGEESPERM